MVQQHPGGLAPQPYAGSVPMSPTAKNWVATTSLLLAVLGLVFCWSVVGGVAFGVLAVVVGISSRTPVKQGRADNGPVAMAGIVLGAVAVVVSLAVIGIWVRLFADVDVPEYADCISRTADQEGLQQCAQELRQRIDDEFGGATAQAMRALPESV